MTAFTPFTGTVAEYLTALHTHNAACETCAPDGLPTPDDGRVCDAGRTIRRSLSSARGRGAGQMGAYL